MLVTVSVRVTSLHGRSIAKICELTKTVLGVTAIGRGELGVSRIP
jgi:hypothetical protein